MAAMSRLLLIALVCGFGAVEALRVPRRNAMTVGPVAAESSLLEVMSGTGGQGSTGGTGATGATGGAPANLVAEKGKPLLKLCIKETGISTQDAEAAADQQETAIKAVLSEKFGGAEFKIQYDEVSPFDPKTDKLEDFCGISEPAATGATGATGGGGARSPAATGGAGPKAADESKGKSSASTTIGGSGSPGAAAGFAGQVVRELTFKAPRHMEKVLQPSLIELNAATGATGTAGSDGGFLIVVVTVQLTEPPSAESAKSGLEALFKDTAKTNQILTEAGFRSPERPVSIALATKIEITRVDKPKPAPKKPVKKKGAASAATVNIATLVAACMSGLWLASR